MAMGHKRGQPGETPANSQKPPPGFRAPGTVGSDCPALPGARGGHGRAARRAPDTGRGGGNGGSPRAPPQRQPRDAAGSTGGMRGRAELPPRPDPAPSLPRSGNGALGRPQIPEIPPGAAVGWGFLPGHPGKAPRGSGGPGRSQPIPVGPSGCGMGFPAEPGKPRGTFQKPPAPPAWELRGLPARLPLGEGNNSGISQNIPGSSPKTG
ncbi:translation initiation factor IF-2-like isoform X3 [Motacilla alba alba]|uniref:translation initiation factor IF-2-like isoform X3 n=1 Tax=Motacilla alba alba TaxID=1094192 RepID=UPI0018D50D2C|nr:translation initiation factor IF-2-like isoform X3 [Motacilla alba alba]